MKNFFLRCLLLGWAILPAAARAATPDAESVATAAAKGDCPTLASLLDQGGPIDARNAHGWPPLICAIEAGKTEAARLLLARHADPNVLSRKGCSPVDFAVMTDGDDILPLLLDLGGDPNGFRVINSNGDPCSPLMLALEHHHAASVRVLLAHGARVEDKNILGNTALVEGSKGPCAEELALLIEKGANVNVLNTYGYNALIYASNNGREDNVRLLLAHGADVHVVAHLDDGTPYGAYEAALREGRPYVLEMLVDAGATSLKDANKFNDELGEAVQSADYERAQAALAKGASANVPASFGVLPLCAAVLVGDPGVVQLLIKAGADVNVEPDGDPRGTPLAMTLDRIAHVTDPKKNQNFQRIAELLRQAHATR